MLTESILDAPKEFDFNIHKMKSFVSDGTSVMTGIHNGVAARLKRVNNVLLIFQSATSWLLLVEILEMKLNTLKRLNEF